MLMRIDPFRELDRLTQHLFSGSVGTAARPAVMPMDAYRDGDEYVVHFDIPGVDPSSIDLDVERNVLTVRAERVLSAPDAAEHQVSERPRGVFSRQLFLGEALDTERIGAHYEAGVLTLRVPVVEQAKPRKISISGRSEPREINA
jgi:HSP20 family protein